MIQVYFKKVNVMPYSELSVYSSLNPIPFTLKMNKESALPETIYARNLFGENFIEFRFNKNTNKLYEITLVAIQNDTVKFVDDNALLIKDVMDGFFVCFIDDNSELEISKPIHVIRNSTSLDIVWDNAALDYFLITENCIIGVNNNNCISSVSLINLSPETLLEIFGF